MSELYMKVGGLFGFPMTIKKTSLGYEDHGILTSTLHCEAPGTGVGVGGYALDQYDKDEERRLGTAYGLDFIARTMETAGVEKWEDLPGKHILVLHETEHPWGSTPVGFASWDGQRTLHFKKHLEEWKARGIVA